MKPESMIEVIQAYIDGKTIQYMKYSTGKWRDIKDQPMFNFSQNDYRVKPEPREFYVYTFDKGRGEQGIAECQKNHSSAFKVKEVIE